MRLTAHVARMEVFRNAHKIGGRLSEERITGKLSWIGSRGLEQNE